MTTETEAKLRKRLEVAEAWIVELGRQVREEHRLRERAEAKLRDKFGFRFPPRVVRAR